MHENIRGTSAQSKGRRENDHVANYVQRGKPKNSATPIGRKQQLPNKEIHKGPPLANHKRPRNDSDQAVAQLIRNAYKSMGHLKDPITLSKADNHQATSGPSRVGIVEKTPDPARVPIVETSTLSSPNNATTSHFIKHPIAKVQVERKDEASDDMDT